MKRARHGTGGNSTRPRGAMAVVIHAIEAMGIKTDPKDLSVIAPKMDIGVLHAHDGTVATDRPVPVQRMTAERTSYSTNYADGSTRMGVQWQGGLRVMGVRPLEVNHNDLDGENEAMPPPVLVLDVKCASEEATVQIVMDWDPHEGMVDHWYELKPPVSFQQHDDHSRTVDDREDRRDCEHGALRLQILLLYQVTAGDNVVNVNAPIVTQVSQALFKSKSRERALVDQLNNVFSVEFAHSKLCGFMQVKVCRARQLPVVADEPRVYCSAEMEGQLYLTKTVQSFNPEWDHSVCFGITNMDSVVSLQILQRDTGNHEQDELYGRVDISPSHFVGDPHTASAFRRWYSISNNDLDEHSGQIELKFFYAPKHQDSLIVVDDFEDTASHIAMRRCTKTLHALSQQSAQVAICIQLMKFALNVMNLVLNI